MKISQEKRSKLARAIAEGASVADVAVRFGLDQEQVRSVAGEDGFKVAVGAYQEALRLEAIGRAYGYQNQLIDRLLEIATEPIEGVSPDAKMAAQLEALRLLLAVPSADARAAQLADELAALRMNFEDLKKKIS